jgi:hypothetical protein
MHLLRFCMFFLLSVIGSWPTASAFAQQRPATNVPADTVPLPEPPNQAFPSTFKPTFQWNYFCPRENAAAGCSLACSPNAAVGSVVAAQVWLGTNDFGNASMPAVYYYLVYFNGREKLVGSGFAHGNRNLSCQIIGMRTTYSGPPK